jgi:hypothetical protein
MSEMYLIYAKCNQITNEIEEQQMGEFQGPER